MNSVADAPEKSGRAFFTVGFAWMALSLPWLNPIATGPASAFFPWLLSVIGLSFWLLFKPHFFPQAVKVAVNAWLIAALLSAVIGFFQYFGVSAHLTPWINQTVAGEAFGNLRQRNQFATLMNIGLAVLVWRVPAYPSVSVWRLFAAALLASAVAASSSRTGMVQLAMLFLLAGLWGGWREGSTRHTVVVALAAYCLAVLVMPRLLGSDAETIGLLARLRDAGPTCASRLVLWANVLDLIAQKPWWGWGWGELDYAHFVTVYHGARFCDILDNAHNLPLHLTVELGLSLAVPAVVVGLSVVLSAKPWRETQPVRRMAWALLALLLLHSMLEYPLWYGPFQITFGLCLWILWSTRGAAQSASPVRTVGYGLAGTGFLAVALLAGAAYAARDYHRVSQLYLATSQRAPAYRDNTLEKVKDSWLFARQVRFAELTTTEVTPENAAYLNAMAHDLLHFSPEARVVEKLIESAELLGRDEEAKSFMTRYQAAFPAAYASWVKSRVLP